MTTEFVSNPHAAFFQNMIFATDFQIQRSQLTSHHIRLAVQLHLLAHMFSAETPDNINAHIFLDHLTSNSPIAKFADGPFLNIPLTMKPAANIQDLLADLLATSYDLTPLQPYL